MIERRRGNGQVERASAYAKEYPDLLRGRLLAKSARDDETGCLLWLGARSINGYGQIRTRHDGNRLHLTHRLAWMLLHGSIPVGLNVLHRCDVRLCIEPEHLFVGTQADNVADMISKGRGQPCRGERSGMAKLTNEDVAAMRGMRADGALIREIAERFGVHAAHASRVLSGKRWAAPP